MALITETPNFVANIYELETTDPVIGGPNGISNLAAQQLTNRTRWIYDQLQGAGLGGEAIEFSGDVDTLSSPGFYLIRSTATNIPISGLGHLLVTGRQSVLETGNAPAAVQLFFSQQTNTVYFRFLADTTWTSWFKVQLTDALLTLRGELSGMIVHFPTLVAPSGWLPANGAAISRTTYATLFARMGTTFGAGNGSTTFNVPDLRGEFIRALDDGRGINPSQALGDFNASKGGLDAHTHDGFGLAGIVTRYVNDLSIGFGDPVIYGVESPETTTSSVDTESYPRNIALLACIKY